MELSWAIIWSCLMRVPVRHWRTLFQYLGRLNATFDEARADGRTWVNWHLREDGVIWVSAWELTEDEQAQRAALPAGHSPWMRAALSLDPAYTGHTSCTAIAPPLHLGRTLPAQQMPAATTAARAPPSGPALIPPKAGIYSNIF